MQHSFSQAYLSCPLYPPYINISKPLGVTKIHSFIPPPPFPFQSVEELTKWTFIQMALFYQEDGASIKDSGQCSAQHRGRWDSLYNEVLERAAVFPGGGRGHSLSLLQQDYSYTNRFHLTKLKGKLRGDRDQDFTVMPQQAGRNYHRLPLRTAEVANCHACLQSNAADWVDHGSLSYPILWAHLGSQRKVTYWFNHGKI